MDIKRYKELMEDAKDWDPDKKFMSANDLCEVEKFSNFSNNFF